MNPMTYIAKLTACFTVFIMLIYQSYGQGPAPQINNIQARNITSLNGRWNYIVDPYENGYYSSKYQAFDQMEKVPAKAYFTDSKPAGKSDLLEYDFDRSGTLVVPRDWNSQKEELFYYEGTIWYRKLFDYRSESSSNRIFIYFGAANYHSEVYLNGKKIGSHTGGFTPFNFEITEILTGEVNSLVVKVDNKRRAEGIPTLNTDWWNYGGITRDVFLVEVPGTFIQDYSIQLDKNNPKFIRGYVRLNGIEQQDEVNISIPELKVSAKVKTDVNGFGEFEVKAGEISMWSPGNPKLYDVRLSSSSDDVSEKIGFRTITTKGTDILLNGKPVFLRGISIHEENPIRGGRAYSIEDARMLLTWAKELNCNYVRLAHYPHNEYMVRLADELGLLVWSENPVYWTIQWDNPETYENALNQLSESIQRDRNRSSVIIWSMANETPVVPERNSFIRSLIDYARSIDGTRLISAALEKHQKPGHPKVQVVEDPLADYIDILGLNEYIGWYDKLPSEIPEIEWEIPYRKPLVISEFGGGALQGLHGTAEERWTEEFQESIYKETLPMLDKIEQFRGVTPWILTDFRSPRRILPGIQDGWNRKGLISETGNKKKAFWVLKSYYDSKAGVEKD